MLVQYIETVFSDKALNTLFYGSDTFNKVMHKLEWSIATGKLLSVPGLEDEFGTIYIVDLMMVLDHYNLLVTEIRHSYASFGVNVSTLEDYYGKTSILEYRKHILVNKYMPKYFTSDISTEVKTPYGIKETGLNRPGFLMSSQVSYRYDKNYIVKYKKHLIENSVYAMKKILKKYPSINNTLHFGKVVEQVVENVITAGKDTVFNLEGLYLDQRGRAVYKGLKRVFNPITDKGARACLVLNKGEILHSHDEDSLNAVYAFIAELLGKKRKRYAEKVLSGVIASLNRELPDSLDRKTIHEYIWLERMYDKLDLLREVGQVYWDIPIELDATMSLGQIIGVLLGEERLLDKTNVIRAGNLKDAWEVEGVRRLSAKKVGTPVFYGSSQSTIKLLRDAGIDIQPDEVLAIRKAFSSGEFGVVKRFKDAIIKNTSIDTPKYIVNGWGEQYEVYVNKFVPAGADLHVYEVFDEKKKIVKKFHLHKVLEVPDYERFKLFTATGLVHNLDSKIADNVCLNIGSNVIAIHDAFLTLPSKALHIKKAYADNLTKLYKNRTAVLTDYRESIGAVGEKADKDFEACFKAVDKIRNFKACHTALK